MSDPMISLMLDAARAAAREIMAVYLGDFAATEKPDGSPVTIADQRAEAVILSILSSAAIPVLAEEATAAGAVVDLRDRFFCVDPLDGTKEFLKRNGEFTVNIALVAQGIVTHGVVLAPASGLTFVGGPEGAFEITSRNEWVRLSPTPQTPPRVVASRSHGHLALNTFCADMDIVENVSVGSSLKFCLLARGDAEVYPRFTPTSEWDTAAGQAVLEAAGGAVLALSGEPLRYGKGAPHTNPFFIAAASPELAAAGAAAMRRAMPQDAVSSTGTGH